MLDGVRWDGREEEKREKGKERYGIGYMLLDLNADALMGLAIKSSVQAVSVRASLIMCYIH